MNIIIYIIAFAVTITLPLVGYIAGRRLGFQADDVEAASIREESKELEERLISTLGDSERLASKAQTEFLAQHCILLTAEIAEQQERFKTISEQVDRTRIDVEAREADQRNLRAMNEEDEAAINLTLNRYNEFSTESISLEQKLAESLRILDTMSTEVHMSPDQQAAFSELSNSLTQTSAQLRDVIIDYQGANERLKTISARFTDLENEYSRLVEQQLAG
jgi:DNA repair exonuclease SbcCD ATPase subunit